MCIHIDICTSIFLCTLKAFSAYIYIHNDVYLYEIFAYHRFKVIIINALGRGYE